ncbi:tRNA-uridine aminocarboxypropyltransferase [Marinomonas ostreistagni]|uniref:tRNA-uridine aminocarboxypropyltransferase n=1 Tax=Marinomonas ostreistagni TaxID=359209 RepID=UPI0019516DEB|nr:DTW domain-containing protein [Marinomonas ostreistagni]MBM6550334.1 DTW domain-containing protein [Marinomonas ostreistagni]
MTNHLKHPLHCVDNLRQQAKQNSQRAFVARGANAERCPSCLMAQFACYCDQRQVQSCDIEITLLYHYTEIHKPTNSGRLIADLFPEQTQAYLWSRTEPDPGLLKRIETFKERSLVLYPATERRLEQGRHLEALPNASAEDPLHIIVLDATWRLASKMLHQSRWLDPLATFAISDDTQRSFKVRHAKHDNQFATAEVMAMLLAQAGLTSQSQVLAQYYQTFNEHSLMSRKRHPNSR